MSLLSSRLNIPCYLSCSLQDLCSSSLVPAKKRLNKLLMVLLTASFPESCGACVSWLQDEYLALNSRGQSQHSRVLHALSGFCLRWRASNKEGLGMVLV